MSLSWYIVRMLQICLGTLDIHGRTHQVVASFVAWFCAGNFDVYVQAKNQLYLSLLPWDIAKYYKFTIVGALGMTSQAYEKW